MGTPSMFENGLNPEDLLGRRFGHHLNFWSMSQRRLTQRIDLGDAHQIVLELRPAHDPASDAPASSAKGMVRGRRAWASWTTSRP